MRKILLIITMLLLLVSTVSAGTLRLTRSSLNECERMKRVQEYYGRDCGDCYEREIQNNIVYSMICEVENYCWHSCTPEDNGCQGRYWRECKNKTGPTGCVNWKGLSKVVGKCGIECKEDSDCPEEWQICGYVQGKANMCKGTPPSPTDPIVVPEKYSSFWERLLAFIRFIMSGFRSWE